MCKKILAIFSVLIVIALVLGFVVFYAAFGGFNFIISVPEPQIKYEEFSCKLTYEIRGEQKVIEDVIVCEFDGFETVGEAGKYRKWNTYMKSSGKNIITLYDLRGSSEYTDWGNRVVELCFVPGNAEYYMGDIDDNRQRSGNMCEWVDYLYETPEKETGYSAFELDEAFEKYGIKLISWECDPPIENEFK